MNIFKTKLTEDNLRNEIRRVAKAELGYSEFPFNTNKTKYGKWFGLDGVAWCGIFCSWVYAQAGWQLPKIGFSKGFAGCQTLGAYARDKKLFTDNPKTGDLVLFDWNSDGRYDHVGVFIEPLAIELFKTVEGNTSLNNNSNGGTVMARSRSYQTAKFVNIIQLYK